MEYYQPKKPSQITPHHLSALTFVTVNRYSIHNKHPFCFLCTILAGRHWFTRFGCAPKLTGPGFESPRSGVCSADHGTVHYKERLKSLDKSRAHSRLRASLCRDIATMHRKRRKAISPTHYIRSMSESEVYL